MAKGKKGKGGFSVRRVNTKEERRRPSVFLRLKVDEAFKGYPLFEPDPEMDDNSGYLEYYDHYDKQRNTYVPCAGERCPFCAANDNPSTRAMTVWYFPDAGDVKDQIKVFTMNYSTVSEAGDESEDEGGMLGKMTRIKRLSDKGDYRVKIMAGKKPLTKAELKKAMKLMEEQIGEGGLVAIVERQLKAQMERLKALDALEDDDDDEDEDEKPKGKARKGKEIEKEDDDEEDDEDEKDEDDEEAVTELENVEVEILKISKKNNTITVKDEDDDEYVLAVDTDEVDLSELSKGDTITVSAEFDTDDETWALTEIADEEDDDEKDEEEDDEDEDGKDDDDGDDDDISGQNFTVVKIQEQDEIFDLKPAAGGKTVKMWLGQGVDVDYDEIKKGVEVTVDATPDDEGDLIITSVELVQGKKGKKGKAKK